MRWSEIVEGSAAEDAHEESARRLKANQKLDDTRRKKNDAARKYQDSMRRANEQQRDAQAKLQTP